MLQGTPGPRPNPQMRQPAVAGAPRLQPGSGTQKIARPVLPAEPRSSILGRTRAHCAASAMRGSAYSHLSGNSLLSSASHRPVCTPCCPSSLSSCCSPPSWRRSPRRQMATKSSGYHPAGAGRGAPAARSAPDFFPYTLILAGASARPGPTLRRRSPAGRPASRPACHRLPRAGTAIASPPSGPPPPGCRPWRTSR